MTPNCIIVISVLLFAWLATAFFLIKQLRLKRLRADDQAANQSLMLLGLMKEKAKEARAAADTLEKVAELLNLGMVHLEEGGKRLKCNQAAKAFFEDYPGKLEELAASDLPPGEARTEMVGNRVLDVRFIEVDQKRLMVLTDMTESFKLARRLKEQERLALLGQMSGQVAHRIKTPLAVLAGRAQMLARRLSPGTKERLQAESIYDEARELASDVDQIVSFYSHQELRPAETALRDLLEDVAKRLNSADTGCQAVVEAIEPEKIFTDRSLLQNALYLVGQNSLDPETGASRVSLSSRLVPSEAKGSKADAGEDSGLSVEILVQDDGKGISKEAKERIFEPFFSTRQEGMGLGLFMAGQILKRLGGTLEAAKAEEGSGACFRITLPASGGGISQGPSSSDGS